jgi:excisionase family DNA binding protein
MTQRLAYSLAEAARATSLSVRSLCYLMQTGKLGYVRLGRRVLIRHDDLERLLRQGYCRPTAPLDADMPIRPTAENGNAPSAGEAERAPERGTAVTEPRRNVGEHSNYTPT